MRKILAEITFSKEINLIYLSTFLFGTALGINFVTFPATLIKNNVSASDIGLAVTCDILATIIISFFLSKISAFLGLMRTLFFACLSFSVSVLLIYFYQNLLLWLIFCFIIGCSWFSYVVTRQAWLNVFLENKRRGIGIGLLSVAISCGLAFGPVIASILGSNSYFSFIISAIFALCSFLALYQIKDQAQGKIEGKRIGFIAFFRKNPRCFLARFLLDFQTFFIIAFTVVFGKKIGLSAEKSGLLISAYMISGLFDVVVGFILKKYSPYKVINVGFIIGLIAISIINFYHQSYLFLLIAYFIFGISAACIFVATITIVNQDYKTEELVAANSTFQSIASLGGLCGTLIGGYFINILDYNGFTINIILACVTYLIFLVIYEKKFQK